MTTSTDPPPVRGDLELELEDGTVLRAGTDVVLARQWTEHLHGPRVWAAMTAAQRSAAITEALTELRRAYAAG